MEMIAASKMKRAQQAALRGRPYIKKLEEVIGHLLAFSNPPLEHPFLQKRDEVRNVGYIFMTSNRGLCGGFNSNIIRNMLEVLRGDAKRGHELVITVGKKGRQAMERVGKAVMADFEEMPDKPTFVDTVGISRVVIDDFLSGRLDEVHMVYNHFFSAISQKPVVKKLLPIEPGDIAEFTTGAKVLKRDYIFGQDRSKLLDEMLQKYVETTVYQTVLESAASEHSARMVAMRQASDNASDIITNLTLHYNKARQAKITKEILEIVSGSMN